MCTSLDVVRIVSSLPCVYECVCICVLSCNHTDEGFEVDPVSIMCTDLPMPIAESDQLLADDDGRRRLRAAFVVLVTALVDSVFTLHCRPRMLGTLCHLPSELRRQSLRSSESLNFMLSQLSFSDD